MSTPPPISSIVLVLTGLAACAGPEPEHDRGPWLGSRTFALDLDAGLGIGIDVTADISAGALRVPSNDGVILDAGYCDTTWHVGPDGDDDSGDGTESDKWRTLHRAMEALASAAADGGTDDCGRILVHYDDDPYRGCSPLPDGGCPPSPDLVTFRDGRGPGSHLMIQGEAAPDGGLPRIVLESDQTFLKIVHKNWTVENLDIDFDGHAGRGILVTSKNLMPDLEPESYQQVTENVVIRNNSIHGNRGCKTATENIATKADAVVISGPTFTLGDFDSFIRSVYVVGNTFADIYLSSGLTGNCDTDNTHNRDDGFGVLIGPKVSDILIAGNVMRNISADGVQCAGISGKENGTASTGACNADADGGVGPDCDPWNIEIVDNQMYVEDADGGIEWRRASENAVDIKSCHKVTVSQNTIWGYLGRDKPAPDAGYPDPDAGEEIGNVKGGAFVAHYGAGDVRVEENDVRDSCGLLGVGFVSANLVHTVENVLVRRNLFVRAKENCEGGGGDGIKITNAHHVDINNNTLVFPQPNDDKYTQGKGVIHSCPVSAATCVFVGPGRA